MKTFGFITVLSFIRSAQLRLMFGVAAVGMDCGHVYLVDLRLDDDVEEFDEWNPSHLQIVDLDNPNIASLRSRAREDGAHMAFELGGMCYEHMDMYANLSNIVLQFVIQIYRDVY